MKKLFAVLATLALLVVGAVAQSPTTVSYDTGSISQQDAASDPSKNVLYGTFDSQAGFHLTVSLPLYWYPFGPNHQPVAEYGAASTNWTTSGNKFCDAGRSPFPSLSFEEIEADGSTSVQTATENSITCNGSYDGTTFTVSGNFSGTNSVSGAPFIGSFSIASRKEGYAVKVWKATDVQWSVTQ